MTLLMDMTLHCSESPNQPCGALHHCHTKDELVYITSDSIARFNNVIAQHLDNVQHTAISQYKYNRIQAQSHNIIAQYIHCSKGHIILQHKASIYIARHNTVLWTIKVMIGVYTKND